jgi:Cu+-exporting ATPase
MALVDVRSTDDVDVDRVLRVAGAIEAASEHPIARAIAAAARHASALDLPTVAEFASDTGRGVRGTIDGVAYELGRPSGKVVVGAGQTVVELRRGGDVLGHLAVADTLKPTSVDAIGRFRELGLEPVLLTGDNEATARSVAAAVGIDSVHAEVMPSDKVRIVRDLQRAGRTVAMVGDGVNDAAALAQAELGIAMGSGTDAAIEASDLTLVRSDLLSAVDAIRLSRRTLGTIKGNLFWAFAYNVLAIPLAMSGRLSPAIAGAAMAFSSVFVVSNSLRLKRFRPVS